MSQICIECGEQEYKYVKGYCVKCYKKKYYEERKEEINKKRKEKYVSTKKPQQFCKICDIEIEYNTRYSLCRKHQLEQYTKQNWDSIKAKKKEWYENKKKINPNWFKEQNTKSKLDHNPDEILKRFKYKCNNCDSTENLQFHHKDERGLNVRKKYRNNSIENIEVLCIKCHSSYHSKITRWSKKHTECQMCNTTERKHQAKGYCTKCYPIHYRRKDS